MTMLTFDPIETTSGVGMTTPAQQPSISSVPRTDEYILVQGGWLPRDQEYYWSEGWQAMERETLAELARGEGVDFDNATDLIRWLFTSAD